MPLMPPVTCPRLIVKIGSALLVAADGRIRREWLAGIAADLAGRRAGDHRPFDLVVGVDVDEDPAPYAAAGATWLLTGFEADTATLHRVRGVLRDGPD